MLTMGTRPKSSAFSRRIGPGPVHVSVADDDEVRVKVRAGRAPGAVHLRHEVIHLRHRIRKDGLDAGPERLEREGDPEGRSEGIGVGTLVTGRDTREPANSARGTSSGTAARSSGSSERRPSATTALPGFAQRHPVYATSIAGGQRVSGDVGVRRVVERGRRGQLRHIGDRIVGADAGALQLSLDLLEQLHHAGTPLGAVVFAQVQLGDAPQTQVAEVVAHERHGPTQRLHSGLALGLVTDDRGPDHGMLKSDVVSTLVMVTNPTRGSWTSRWTMALISSCRRWSTRRVRSLTGYLVTARAMVSVVNDSMMSSSSNWWKPASAMPHSKPAVTSRTSSLKRRTDEILSVAMSWPLR